MVPLAFIGSSLDLVYAGLLTARGIIDMFSTGWFAHVLEAIFMTIIGISCLILELYEPSWFTEIFPLYGHSIGRAVIYAFLASIDVSKNWFEMLTFIFGLVLSLFWVITKISGMLESPKAFFAAKNEYADMGTSQT